MTIRAAAVRLGAGLAWAGLGWRGKDADLVDHTGDSRERTRHGPDRELDSEGTPQRTHRDSITVWDAVASSRTEASDPLSWPDRNYAAEHGERRWFLPASVVLAEIVADRANGTYKNPADPLSHREYQKLARELSDRIIGDNDPGMEPLSDGDESTADLSATFRELYDQAVAAPGSGAAAAEPVADFAKLGALLKTHNLEEHPAAAAMVADLKARRPDYRDLNQVPLTAAERRRLLAGAGPRAVLPYLRPPRVAGLAKQPPSRATESSAADMLRSTGETVASDSPAEATDSSSKLYGDIVREHVDAIKQQRQYPPLNRPELAKLAKELASRVAAGQTLCPPVDSADDGESYSASAVRDRGVMAVFQQSPPGLEATVFSKIETTIADYLFPHGDRSQPARELTSPQLRILGKLLREYGIEYSPRPAVSAVVRSIVAERAAAPELSRGETITLAWSLVHKVQFGGGLEPSTIPDPRMEGVLRQVAGLLGDPGYANLTEGGLTKRGYRILAKYLQNNGIERTEDPDIQAMISAIKDARPDIGDLPLTPLEERLLAGQLMQVSLDEMRRNGGFDWTRLQLGEIVRHYLEGGAIEVETTNLYISDSIPDNAIPIITEGPHGLEYETDCRSGITSDGRFIEQTAVMTIDNMTEADKVGFSLARAFVKVLRGARFVALADDRMEVVKQKAGREEEESDGRSVRMVGVSDRLSQRYLESILEVARHMGIVSPGARNREECTVISEKEKLGAAADLERNLSRQTQDPPPHAHQKPIAVPAGLAAKGWATPTRRPATRTMLMRTSGRETRFHNYHAENPLHQKFVTSDHNGPRCVTLDASTYLSTEGMFVVLLPLAKDDGLTRRNGGLPIMSQADQVWELLRSTGFPPDRVMVALYDPSVGAEKLSMKLSETITAELAKYQDSRSSIPPVAVEAELRGYRPVVPARGDVGKPVDRPGRRRESPSPALV